MKTNVSIKFNSIEEYREIERVLEGLGLENQKEWNKILINKINKGFVNIEKVLFYIDSSQMYLKNYNSLQEFLNDNAETY